MCTHPQGAECLREAGVARSLQKQETVAPEADFVKRRSSPLLDFLAQIAPWSFFMKLVLFSGISEFISENPLSLCPAMNAKVLGKIVDVCILLAVKL